MKEKYLKQNRGMTYVELIVVLGIFSMMAGISSYNYRAFQKRVEITNLANDIGLKIVQAQKDASSGKIAATTPTFNPILGWKPSYGFQFHIANVNYTKSFFLYLADGNNDKRYTGVSYKDIFENGLESAVCDRECMEIIKITNGNFISNIELFQQGVNTQILSGQLTIVFTRPDTAPTVDYMGSPITVYDYIKITVSPPKQDNKPGKTIKLYSSGRIQIE